MINGTMYLPACAEVVTDAILTTKSQGIGNKRGGVSRKNDWANVYHHDMNASY
jgi:hypothetical protein